MSTTGTEVVTLKQLKMLAQQLGGAGGNLPFYKTYGVRIATGNSNPASALTYIDDAVGKSAGWANWKDEPIFKKIKPCVVKDGVVQYYLNPDNFTQKADGGATTNQ